MNLEHIASLYDAKTKDPSGINLKLAQVDSLFFNHNGILLPSESLSDYQYRIQGEESLLGLLHIMEQNTVRLGSLHLGSPDQDMVVLDAGCGAGGSGIMIHHNFRCRVEGYTLSSAQAFYGNQAAKTYGCDEAVCFMQGDVLNLENRRGTFDCIWACESTEHMKDLLKMFNAFSELAKNNARLVIIAWCARDPALKTTVDNHYLTWIHHVEDYLHFAAKTSWKCIYQLDLTEATASYWELRATSINRSGSENFMLEGFKQRNIEYHLLVFDH